MLSINCYRAAYTVLTKWRRELHGLCCIFPPEALRRLKKNACVPPITHRRKLSAQGAANDSVILDCLGVVITKQVIMFAATS